MLSHAGSEIGFGWAFGVHEAMNQVRAVRAFIGCGDPGLSRELPPRVCRAPDSHRNLSQPGARRAPLHPRPHDLEVKTGDVKMKGLPRVFWLYLAGAGGGSRLRRFSADRVPLHQSVVRADRLGADCLFHCDGRKRSRLARLWAIVRPLRHWDKLIPLTLVAAAFAPLVFLGGFWPALIGSAIWGLGMGVHESIIPAAVAPMVSPEHRASAYGLFTAGYGVAWFLGSVVLGILYDHSVIATIVFGVALQLACRSDFLRCAAAIQRLSEAIITWRAPCESRNRQLCRAASRHNQDAGGLDSSPSFCSVRPRPFSGSRTLILPCQGASSRGTTRPATWRGRQTEPPNPGRHFTIGESIRPGCWDGQDWRRGW